MKNLIIILMLCCSLVTNAQILYNETRADALEYEQRMNAYHQRTLDSHIRSCKTYEYKSLDKATTDKGYLSSEILYNSQGNLSESTEYNKRGKIKYHWVYKYDAQNRLLEYAWLSSEGKMIYKSTFTFDAAGNNTNEREFFKKPDYVYWHSNSKFDNKQNITELNYFTKNDKRQGMKYIYAYYPDGSKKQTIEYNPKGKVTHTWNYDCNPSGALVAKNLKDTSKICIRYETDKDGNQIKIKEENVKQGNIVRIVSKYDKSDNMIDRVQYDVKGRARFHSVGVFDKMNNRTEFTVLNCVTNKIKERFVYQYDTNGNITELVAYKKSPEPNHIYKYNYTQAQ